MKVRVYGHVSPSLSLPGGWPGGHSSWISLEHDGVCAHVCDVEGCGCRMSRGVGVKQMHAWSELLCLEMCVK